MNASPSALREVGCPLCAGTRFQARYHKNGLTIVQCSGCALLFVNPRPEPEAIASVYVERYFSDGGGEFPGASYLDHAEEKLETARLRLKLLERFARPGRLLDVGCGAGYFVRAAKEARWDASGLEPSPVAAAFGRERLGVQITEGVVGSVRFLEGRFDVVTMLDVIEHLDSPLHELGEIKQVLKPDGWLMIETPNVSGRLVRLLGDWHPYYRPWEHLTYFTPTTLLPLLERAGFSVQTLGGGSKYVSVYYLVSVAASSNPKLATLGRMAAKLCGPLGRKPFRLPMDTIVAVARKEGE